LGDERVAQTVAPRAVPWGGCSAARSAVLMAEKTGEHWVAWMVGLRAAPSAWKTAVTKAAQKAGQKELLLVALKAARRAAR